MEAPIQGLDSEAEMTDKPRPAPRHIQAYMLEQKRLVYINTMALKWLKEHPQEAKSFNPYKNMPNFNQQWLNEQELKDDR